MLVGEQFSSTVIDVYCSSPSFFQEDSKEGGIWADAMVAMVSLGTTSFFLEKHSDIALVMLLNKAVIRFE